MFLDGEKVFSSYNGHIICVTINQETCFLQLGIRISQDTVEGRGPSIRLPDAPLN